MVHGEGAWVWFHVPVHHGVMEQCFIPGVLRVCGRFIIEPARGGCRVVGLVVEKKIRNSTTALNALRCCEVRGGLVIFIEVVVVLQCVFWVD